MDVWYRDLELLEVFHKWLNSKLPGIKFTKSFSSDGIEFLNSFVYCCVDKILQTKSYSKPCDEHTYLVPFSCHPTHNIRNIPHSTGHTIYRIASEIHEYAISKGQYTDFLKARGYSAEAFRKLLINLKPRIEYHTWNQMLNMSTRIRFSPSFGFQPCSS